jgi:hypothetical protein
MNLHPLGACRECDEIRALRSRLSEVEAENEKLRGLLERVQELALEHHEAELHDEIQSALERK